MNWQIASKSKARTIGGTIFLIALILAAVIMSCCCSNIYKVGEISIQRIPMKDDEAYEDFTVRFGIEAARVKKDGHQILFSEIIEVVRTGEVFGIIIYR